MNSKPTGLLMAEDAFMERNFKTLHDNIAVRAYFKAQKRGFAPGYALEWLAAEAEILKKMRWCMYNREKEDGGAVVFAKSNQCDILKQDSAVASLTGCAPSFPCLTTGVLSDKSNFAIFLARFTAR